MALKLVRVDDRLIHGQVVAVWLRSVGADRILVIDDKSARDAFLKDLMVLAAPQGVPVEVLTVDEGTRRATEIANTTEQAFVLVKSPVTALQLRKAGVPFGVLNVGGMGHNAGRRSLYKNISANDEERQAMRDLESMGTRVELRIVADDRPVPFSSVDKSA